MRLEDSWASSPVENFHGMPEADRRRLEYEQMNWMMLPRAKRMRCIQWAKSVLGRQAFCWIGSENRRFYVWEGEDWRLFVHDAKGLCFEVRDTVEHDAVAGVWDEFKKKIGWVIK